jgi:hypothetical protein
MQNRNPKQVTIKETKYKVEPNSSCGQERVYDSRTQIRDNGIRTQRSASVLLERVSMSATK